MLAELENDMNDCVFTPKIGHGNFSRVPKILYFYKLSVDQGGKFEMSSYFFHNGKADDSWDKIRSSEVAEITPHSASGGQGSIDSAIEQIAQIAHSDNGSSEWRLENAPWKKPPADTLNSFRWKGQCYVAFTFDDPAWQIAPGGAACPAIFFDNGKAGGSFGNHTFFDAHEQKVKVDGRANNVICLVNHLKKDGPGNDLGNLERQSFKFNIRADVALADGSGTVRVIIDPDGENEGPP